MATLDSNLLGVDLAGLTLHCPIIAAAGTAGYVDELADVLDLQWFGALTCKSITVESRAGNETWRVVPVPGGMMNAIGLANVGLDRFLTEVVPRIKRSITPVIGSIAAGSAAEYVQIAEAMEKTTCLPAIELNVSCPNTDDGRLFSDSPEQCADLVAEVRGVVKQSRLLVKLPPSAGSLLPLAQAAVDAGADVLTICNTLPGLAIDVETGKPRLARGVGGVSGPAIHALAVRLVREVYQGVARDANVPIIGVGGVSRWQDAAEFILAGATAVGMGTALFADPRSPKKVAYGLTRWVRRRGMQNLSALVGTADL